MIRKEVRTMKKFITGSIAALLAVAVMIPTTAMAASSTTQDDSPVPKSSYVEVSANSDTNAALTAEEKATLNKAYDELKLLFDELDTLYDDEGNLKSGSEQKAAELESRIDAISDSIADIEDKAYFAELSASLSDEEIATLKKAYDELEPLFDELDTLYDDEGNLKSGSEQKAAELESRIEAIYDSIADIEEKAFFADLYTGLSDEEIGTKAYDELDALFDELDTLYDDEGNVKSGSEQKAAELESRIADLCASLSNEKMEIFTFTD